MNKFSLIFVGLFGTQSWAYGGTPVQITLDDLSKQRTICGFTFASVKGLSVVAKSIPESSLRTRVDNERYDACPYKVQLTYQGLGIPLDFGRDVNLERVRNAAGGDFVRMAFFRQSENGWVAAGEDIEVEQGGIAVHEGKSSLALSAIFRRKPQTANAQDFCFSIDVIGGEKYLSGAVCRPMMSELEALDRLFRKESVISSGR